MGADLFVCVDWGTSRMRATLCEFREAGLHEVDTRTGPGVHTARGRLEETLFDTIEPWIAEWGQMPLLLSGMVGSNIGWRHLPYLKCPIRPAEVAGQCLTFENRGHRVVMVPGLECVNDLGQPDVMRGEELQVLGWLAGNAMHGRGEWLVCLPGTHTKWVTVLDGCILSFRTAITGELYSLLVRHSVLLARDGGPEGESEFDMEGFLAGVDQSSARPEAILQLLFSTRSRMLRGVAPPDAAASYLSGLLIGNDCATIVGRGNAQWRNVALVGDPTLCQRFSTALGRLGVGSASLDGRQAALAGFAQVYRYLTGDREVAAGAS